jgi:hypothetical protein
MVFFFLVKYFELFFILVIVIPVITGDLVNIACKAIFFTGYRFSALAYRLALREFMVAASAALQRL